MRYHINTPVLSTWGRHMGYYVRPTERNKGYAKEMVRQNLQNCRRQSLKYITATSDRMNEIYNILQKENSK